MASQQCQAIEKHIKDMLYNNSIGPQPPFPNNNHSPLLVQTVGKGQLFDTSHLASNIEEHAFLTTDNFKTRIPFGDLTLSQEKQIDQPCSSELIDLNNLTNFAEKHLNDSSFATSGMSLNCDKILPHPELDESQVKPENEEAQESSPSKISVLLNSISQEIQRSPNFRSMPENPLSHPAQSPSKKAKTNRFEEKKPKKSSLMTPEEKKEMKKQKKLKKKLKEQTAKKSPNDARSSSRKEESPSHAFEAEINNLRIKLPSQSSGKTGPVLMTTASCANQKFDVLQPSYFLPVHPLTRQILIPYRSNLLEKADSSKNSSQLMHGVQEIKVKKDILSSNWLEYSLTLKKNSLHFSCDVCDYNSLDEAAINKHLKSSSHKEQKELKEADIYLSALPDPLPEQIEAVTQLILHQADLFGFKEQDFIDRTIIAENLKKLVEHDLPSCTTEMIGSSVSQFGHRNSQVDFILKVPSDMNAADALATTYELLLKDPGYDRIVTFFQKKIPQIQFLDIDTKLQCTLILDNGSSFQLAKLLSTYAQLDDRVPILGAVLRNWAYMCHIDDQDVGTLPSFAYALFLVYFLQQTEPPILPVLQEVEGYNDTPDFLDSYLAGKKWHSENKDPVGLLWIKFFHFYNYVYASGEHVVCIRSLKKVSCKEKNWGTKFYAIEDPFVRRNIAYVIPTHQVYRYIQQCFVRTYRHFAYPRLTCETLCVKAKGEDPLKDGTVDLTPDTDNNESKEDIIDDNDASENSFSNDPLEVNDSLLEDHDAEIPVDDLISTISKLILDEKTEEDVDANDENSEFHDASSSFDPPLEENSNKTLSPEKELTPQSPKKKVAELKKAVNLKEFYFWDIEGKSFDMTDFAYVFRTKTFRGEKTVPLFCKSCLCKGHLKHECPQEELPATFPLPEMTDCFRELLDKICISIMEENSPTQQQLRNRKADMKEIEEFIRKELFPDANLDFFGSFCNGFGFKESDMDFCLTFEKNENGKDLDCVNIIKKLAATLTHHPKLLDVTPITTAKVPIVKFRHKDSRLEGDISLYNTLAQHNTKMLEAYSKIDSRVKVLGYVLKYFAKVLGIGDASRGSLSSYAYILMVIFYLQQTNPPVIPVLQELCNEQNAVFMVEGWNAWFYEDISKLKEVWSEFGNNKKSIGDLWLGLLNFYARDFDLKKNVVCIRQKEPLSRFRKLWISDQIAIEDPFDLNHNLGAGLSRKMNSYILKAFIRGRERFGHPITLERMNSILGNETAYLFDCQFLSNGRDPPNDRGCRICRRIGHLARDCTQNKELRNANKSVKAKDKQSPKAPLAYGGNRYSNQRDRDRQNYRNQQPNSRRTDQPHRNNNNNNNYSPVIPKSNNPNLKMEGQQQHQQRIQLPIGIPAHRFPPPGFQGVHQGAAPAPPGFPANPPPGFTTNLSQPNYMAPFGNQRPMLSSPFPMNPGNKAAEHQPHKQQFSASPPKQFATPPPKQKFATSPPKQFMASPNFHASGFQQQPLNKPGNNNSNFNKSWGPGNRSGYQQPYQYSEQCSSRSSNYPYTRNTRNMGSQQQSSHHQSNERTRGNSESYQDRPNYRW